MVPIPTPIYHITDTDNLPSILACGGLRPCRWLINNSHPYTNIAYETIQDRRAITTVPCGPGGTLHDCIPFYFGPRSPMLYTINRGNVPGYSKGQDSVLHLVSTAQVMQSAGCRFVFTDGHGIMILSEFFEDLARLDRIDWPLISSKYWADTMEDSDRKRRRQAEFLVHAFCPWDLITEIGVISASAQAEVKRLLEPATHKPVVTVRRGWYY